MLLSPWCVNKTCIFNQIWKIIFTFYNNRFFNSSFYFQEIERTPPEPSEIELDQTKSPSPAKCDQTDSENIDESSSVDDSSSIEEQEVPKKSVSLVKTVSPGKGDGSSCPTLTVSVVSENEQERIKDLKDILDPINKKLIDTKTSPMVENKNEKVKNADAAKEESQEERNVEDMLEKENDDKEETAPTSAEPCDEISSDSSPKLKAEDSLAETEQHPSLPEDNEAVMQDETEIVAEDHNDKLALVVEDNNLEKCAEEPSDNPSQEIKENEPEIEEEQGEKVQPLVDYDSSDDTPPDSNDNDDDDQAMEEVEISAKDLVEIDLESGAILGNASIALVDSSLHIQEGNSEQPALMFRTIDGKENSAIVSMDTEHHQSESDQNTAHHTIDSDGNLQFIATTNAEVTNEPKETTEFEHSKDTSCPSNGIAKSTLESMDVVEEMVVSPQEESSSNDPGGVVALSLRSASADPPQIVNNILSSIDNSTGMCYCES